MPFGLNTSIHALVASSLARTPYIFVPKAKQAQHFSLTFSSLSHFTSNFFRTQSNQVSLYMGKTKMANFLDSTIHINTYDPKYYRNNVDGKKKTDNLSETSGNVTLQEMTWTNCQTPVDGGVAFIIFRNDVYCNFSSCTNCVAEGKGGAFLIVALNVNFTQPCFLNCKALKGSTIMIPLAYEQASFEGLSAESCISGNQDTIDGIFNVYVKANEIIASGCNFSNNQADDQSALCIVSNHDIHSTELTFANNKQEGTPSSKSEYKAVTTFSGIAMAKNFNKANFINNEAKGGAIFFCDIDYSTILQFAFRENIVNGAVDMNKALIVFDHATDTEITVTGCHFDVTTQAEAAVYATQKATSTAHLLAAPVINFEDNQLKDAEAEPPALFDLHYVTTHGCWGHSHYKWSTPSGVVIYLVIAFVVLSLVSAFVYVILHKRALDKKAEEANLSIVDDAHASLM